MAATRSSTTAYSSSTTSAFQSTRTPRAPPDLGTYSRALLSYTQRQMEELRVGYSRSETASGDKSASPPVSAPNGTPSSASATARARRRSPSAATSASSVAVHPPSPVSSEFGYRV